MNRIGKYTFGALATLVAIGVGATPAKAGFVINFEDLQTNGSYIDIPNNYMGFSWNSTLDAVDLTNGWPGTGPAHSGLNAIVNNTGDVGVVTADSGTFTLDGLFIRTWFSLNAEQAGEIRGYNGSTLVFTSAFTITDSWQFVAGSSQQITRFKIDGGGFFLVDDISIDNSTPVVAPAPPAAALFAVGFVGLAGFRRLRGKSDVASAA